MLSTGLLILARFDAASKYGSAFRGAAPIGGLTHDEVAKRYKGIDGDPWGPRILTADSEYPFLRETGLADVGRFREVREALTKDFGPECDLIYIGGVQPPLDLPHSFSFAGYDYGYYESIWSFHSVVRYEVIYGHIPALRAFGASLNANLLLPGAEEASRLGAVRAPLLRQGLGLEDDSDDWHVIGVWLYSKGVPTV